MIEKLPEYNPMPVEHGTDIFESKDLLLKDIVDKLNEVIEHYNYPTL